MKYKNHKHLERKRENGETFYRLLCERCSGSFWGGRPNARFCSQACKQKVPMRIYPVSVETLAEANSWGATHKEKLLKAAEIEGVHYNTVRRWMKIHKYEWTPEYSTLRTGTESKRFKAEDSPCIVCGENRAVDAAHIIEAADGGATHMDNLVPLCPTHHRLWDRGLLNQQESEELEQYFSTKIGQMAGVGIASEQ